MTGFTAFYSIAQYCPDATRAEVVNVGLVTFINATLTIMSRFVPVRKRVGQVFPEFLADCEALECELDSIREWARISSGKLSQERFFEFVSSNQGWVRFTEPRWVRFDDIEVGLDSLANRTLTGYVKHYGKSRKVSAFVHAMDVRVRPLVDEGRVLYRPRVNVPGYNVDMHVHYGYEMGSQLYIMVEYFSQRRSLAIDMGAKLAFKGRQLSKGSGRHQRLAVISLFDSEEASIELRPLLASMFDENDVSLIEERSIERVFSEMQNAPFLSSSVK